MVWLLERYDMVYPQAVLADYLDFFLVRPRAAAVLAAYPHDFVLLRVASPAYGFMMAQPGWRIVIGIKLRLFSPARTRRPHNTRASRSKDGPDLISFCSRCTDAARPAALAVPRAASANIL